VTENSELEAGRRRVQLDPAAIAFAALADEYRRARRVEKTVDPSAGVQDSHPSHTIQALELFLAAVRKVR
jgi:hypothetical protein